jgi:hypothetical protein
MKWKEEEIEKAISLLREGKSYKEISIVLNKTEGSIRNKLNQHGEKSSTYFVKKSLVNKNCLECNSVYSDLDSRQNRKFCSQSCNATYNNKIRGCKTHSIKLCICGSETKKKFCSRECYNYFVKNEIINSIENKENFNERTIKKYLINKYGEKCMECGWNKIHPITGKVPIQLEHIDGNSTNNDLGNLKLLCPNCHSLTETFGALNKRKNERKRKE